MPRDQKLTRRAFLGAAVATAVAPYVISGRALGRAAPSGRITLGMIGIGNMGGGHLEAFLGNGDVQIVAVCDVDRTKRENARTKVEEQYAAATESGTYHGCDIYNEFEELLARRDIDAVVIAVPDHWHAIVAITACRMGKDVYCEKPLALTIREAREMANTARRYARVFQTGSQQRSDNLFRYACELVRNQRIGKLQTVHVGIGGPSREKYFSPEPVPDGFDWERWLGPAPWAPYNAERCSGDYGGGWRHVRDYSGGMMTDWGAHHFDIAQWGIGADETGPVEIIPPESGPPDIRTTPTPDNTLVYKYANGVTMYHGGANGILFTGSEGKVEVNRGYFKTWPEEIGKEPIGPNDLHLYESKDHRQNWLDCIRTRSRPIADVEIGCHSVTVCHLGNIAYWLARPIRWDPHREEIIGDAAASAWLDRPKRAPWRLYV
ncbi:MAG TPA: Gfo/Idh/MocA family oxidoreductase [Phycisphaerae bacterium]